MEKKTPRFLAFSLAKSCLAETKISWPSPLFFHVSIILSDPETGFSFVFSSPVTYTLLSQNVYSFFLVGRHVYFK